MTTGVISFGSSFAYGTGSPPSVVKGLINADPADIEVNQIKMGAVDDSTAWFNFASGRITGGVLKLTYEFRSNPDNWTVFFNLLRTDNCNFIYTLADTSYASGTGNIATLSPPKVPEDDRDTFDVGVQVVTWTWTPAH